MTQKNKKYVLFSVLSVSSVRDLLHIRSVIRLPWSKKYFSVS